MSLRLLETHFYCTTKMLRCIFYFRKEGTKPQLELETTSGVFLSDEDPLSLLFPLGAVQAEPVIGKIVKMSLPPLAERYKEACSQMDTGEILYRFYISL